MNHEIRERHEKKRLTESATLLTSGLSGRLDEMYTRNSTCMGQLIGPSERAIANW
jgi:hypothetical protein